MASFMKTRTLQTVINYSDFTNADDEYTAAQRRIIDRRLAQSEKEYKEDLGPGPFDTAEKMIASLHKELVRLRSKKNKSAVK
jgi:hypothetical protein